MHNYIVFLKIYGMLGDFRINRDAKVKKRGDFEVVTGVPENFKIYGMCRFLTHHTY